MRECQPCRPAKNFIASADRVSPYEEGRETGECEITLSAFSSDGFFYLTLKQIQCRHPSTVKANVGKGKGRPQIGS